MNSAVDSLSRFPVVQPLEHDKSLGEFRLYVGGCNDSQEGEDGVICD